MTQKGIENIVCVPKFIKNSFPVAGNFLLAAGAATAQTSMNWSFFAIGMFFLLGINYVPKKFTNCKHKK